MHNGDLAATFTEICPWTGSDFDMLQIALQGFCNPRSKYLVWSYKPNRAKAIGDQTLSTPVTDPTFGLDLNVKQYKCLAPYSFLICSYMNHLLQFPQIMGFDCGAFLRISTTSRFSTEKNFKEKQESESW